MIRNTFSVVKRIFRNLRNDRHTLLLILLAPVFAMLLFGLAFTGEIKDVKLIVVNQDAGAEFPLLGERRLSDLIIAELDPNILQLTYLDDEATAIEEVRNGKAYGVMTFPVDFTRDTLARLKVTEAPQAGNAGVILRLDQSNLLVASDIQKEVSEALLAMVKNLGQDAPLVLAPIYGDNARFIDSLVPGIVVLVVFLLALQLTLLAFVGERSSGTLSRLLTTPIKPTSVVGGYAVAFSIVGALQSVILLTIGVLVFKISIIGNVLLAFVVIVLLAIVSQSVGILLSSLARDESHAIQMMTFVVMPTFLLAGVFWPLEAIPGWLRPLAYAVPPTYAVNACRSVMLRGWSASQIWVELVALTAFALLLLTAAVWSVKKHRS
ncbi:MAG: ABC transporter permease [Candidatus Geothermincolia bacterium]